MTQKNCTTLQRFYNQYMDIQKEWYKEAYNSDQDSIFTNVHDALENALINLPILNLEDRKIKLNMLKILACWHLFDQEGKVDWNKKVGREKDVVLITNQLFDTE